MILSFLECLMKHKRRLLAAIEEPAVSFRFPHVRIFGRLRHDSDRQTFFFVNRAKRVAVMKLFRKDFDGVDSERLILDNGVSSNVVDFVI